MHKVGTFLLVVMTVSLFALMMGNDYYLFNPISMLFKKGWGELEFDYYANYQRMGMTLRYDKYDYVIGGSIWYTGEELILKPSNGWANLGVGGVVRLADMVYLSGALGVNLADLSSDFNVSFAFGGSTRKYFRFARGFSSRGVAAIYYQPYFSDSFDLSNAYLGIFMDTWGVDGRIAFDIKLDLAFTKEEGTLFDFVRIVGVYVNNGFMISAGWNVDHVISAMKNNTYVGAGVDNGAFKFWGEIYISRDITLTTWAVKALLSF